MATAASAITPVPYADHYEHLAAELDLLRMRLGELVSRTNGAGSPAREPRSVAVGGAGAGATPWMRHGP